MKEQKETEKYYYYAIKPEFMKFLLSETFDKIDEITSITTYYDKDEKRLFRVCGKTNNNEFVINISFKEALLKMKEEC